MKHSQAALSAVDWSFAADRYQERLAQPSINHEQFLLVNKKSVMTRPQWLAWHQKKLAQLSIFFLCHNCKLIKHSQAAVGFSVTRHEPGCLAHPLINIEQYTTKMLPVNWHWLWVIYLKQIFLLHSVWHRLIRTVWHTSQSKRRPITNNEQTISTVTTSTTVLARGSLTHL